MVSLAVSDVQAERTSRVHRVDAFDAALPLLANRRLHLRVSSHLATLTLQCTPCFALQVELEDDGIHRVADLFIDFFDLVQVRSRKHLLQAFEE